jgi:hypothetical protein|tara:strand:- start:8747 stop:9052 length:306 start_codon:yes stop_codon:yes gene_type:complete
MKMEIKIEELIIDGKKWTIEYSEDYKDGWKLINHFRPSIRGLSMASKKNSPIDSHRQEYKAWKAKKKRDSQTRKALVHALLQSVEIINSEDLILKSDDSEE